MPHVKLWELIHLVLARAVMGEGTHSEGSFASLAGLPGSAPDNSAYSSPSLAKTCTQSDKYKGSWRKKI